MYQNLGKFMRKYSIDELPQLFNILYGSMTLIGPRPPVLSEVNEYKDISGVDFLIEAGVEVCKIDEENLYEQ